MPCLQNQVIAVLAPPDREPAAALRGGLSTTLTLSTSQDALVGNRETRLPSRSPSAAPDCRANSGTGGEVEVSRTSRRASHSVHPGPARRRPHHSRCPTNPIADRCHLAVGHRHIPRMATLTRPPSPDTPLTIRPTRKTPPAMERESPTGAIHAFAIFYTNVHDRCRVPCSPVNQPAPPPIRKALRTIAIHITTHRQRQATHSSLKLKTTLKLLATKVPGPRCSARPWWWPNPRA